MYNVCILIVITYIEAHIEESNEYNIIFIAEIYNF